MPQTTPVPVNPGPTWWSGPRGRWRPAAGAARITVGNLRPPRREVSTARWAARLFVGVTVGGVETWTIEDVVARVRARHRKGAPFVAQLGIWPSESCPVEESSVQVIVFDTSRTSPKEFRVQVVALADALALDLQQEEVVVELQRNGVVQGVMGVGPLPSPAGLTSSRARRPRPGGPRGSSRR